MVNIMLIKRYGQINNMYTGHKTKMAIITTMVTILYLIDNKPWMTKYK